MNRTIKYVVISAFILCLLIVLFLFLKDTLFQKDDFIFKEKKEAEPVPGEKLYGLSVDSFLIEKGVVRKNENLSNILAGFGVSLQIIDRIARNFRDTFDVRKIKAGNEYTAFFSKDTAKKIVWFVYEHNPAEYILFDLRDTLNVEKKKRTIIVVRKTGYGIIQSSLWNTMKESGMNMLLALELSDIYAWTIDFFGLQKGDCFSVVYEELYVADKCIGFGKVCAACFTYAGKDFYAIPFYQDERISFFNLEGENLRKAFLKAPLRFSRISSYYSHSRMHPVLKIRRPHHGVDYSAPTGTPVYAIGDGRIIKKGYQPSGGGKFLKIKHNSVYSTVYMHLSGYSKGMNESVFVKQSDLIGYVGSTGLATGPHLDFRFYKNGTPVDPLKVESPPAEPVRKEYMDEFKTIRDSLLNQLLKIERK